MSTRIVVAPDSFKESMTAVQASRAMAAGVRDSLPMCLVDQVPRLRRSERVSLRPCPPPGAPYGEQ